MFDLGRKAVNRKDAVNNSMEVSIDRSQAKRDANRARFTQIHAQAVKIGLMSRWVRPSVNLRTKAEFYHRLAQTLEIGLPIVSALEENRRYLPSKLMQQVSAELKRAVENGRALHDAMGDHAHIFQKSEIHVVRMSEERDALSVCLKQLAAFLLWKDNLRALIRKAAVYPCFVVVAILAVMAIWIGYVLPQIVELLSEMGVPAPRATTMVFSLGEWFKVNGGWLALAGVSAALGIYLFQRTEKGGVQFDWGLLKLPLLGQVLRNIALARLGQNFVIMSSAGIAARTIFNLLAKNGVGNRFLEFRLRAALKTLQPDESIAAAFDAAGGYPAVLLNVFRSAETQDNLDQSFRQLGERCDGEVQRTVQRILNVFEPITIVLLGVVFGVIAVSVLLPLCDIVGAMPKSVDPAV